MFVRAIRKRLEKNGVKYEYVQHRLVESVRTEHGPRQRTLLNLGTLPIGQEHFKTLANLIEQRLVNCECPSLFGDVPEEVVVLAQHFADIIKQKNLTKASQPPTAPPGDQAPLNATTPEPNYETIDTGSIATSNSRSIGMEHIALTQLRQLGFDAILNQCGFSPKELALAAAQICARIVHPASERETARWLRNDSALAELLGVDFTHVSDQALHRISDRLRDHKDSIERALSHNTNDLFSLDDKLILYDLTNTYFESPKFGSTIAKYGKSKEKRKDCPLISLALVVDGMGFPKRSRLLEGNIVEPHTLSTILEQLEIADTTTDGHPRTIVIDAGIATEENLKKLRDDPRFEYVAVSRSKLPRRLFEQSAAQTLPLSHDKEMTVKTLRQENEVFLLCTSPDRTLKDEAIHVRRKERFEKELAKLNEGLRKPRTGKKLALIHERIGRLKERYGIGNLYSIEVKEHDGIACEIAWTYQSDKAQPPGEYVIRTSRKDLPDTEISTIHRTLTMIEAAFKWLKSDLGLRPNFHQKDDRMSTHAIISVLAYFVLAPLLNKLGWGGNFVSYTSRKEDHTPWKIPFGCKGLVRTMSSQTRVTTSFKCKDGKTLDARTTVEPNAEQLAVYNRLTINPRPLRRILKKHDA